MDWENVVADVQKILSVHYTPGRNGNSIDKIIIHHNGGNLSVDGCYNVWQNRAASAHYQVCTDGTIGQLVWDKNTAWHASNWSANLTSIGIEHADCQSDPWRISDACLDNGSHLVAALCKYYDLGRPEWGSNLFGHSDFAATECPASLAEGGSQHDEYVARAQYWYDVMTGARTEEDDMEPHDVWEYDWENTAPGGNMYNCTTATYYNTQNLINMVNELKATEAAQTEAIKALASMRGADPAEVAQAVSDAVSKKLETIKLNVSTE